MHKGRKLMEKFLHFYFNLPFLYLITPQTTTLHEWYTIFIFIKKCDFDTSPFDKKKLKLNKNK